jgi:8-oxo-dGTP pyrophosphatase MutT (NUDIX family)
VAAPAPDAGPARPFAKLSESLLHEGSVVSFATGVFEAPDGTRFERDLVHHPGAVSVVPLLDDGTVVLVRQYRAAVDRELLEIPAGKRDVEGEPTEVTAARELQEEVGYEAGRLDLLAEFLNSPGFCDEHSWVYLATGLRAVAAEAVSLEEQYLTVEHRRLADVPALIASGEIVDAKTIIGLTLTLLRAGG